MPQAATATLNRQVFVALGTFCKIVLGRRLWRGHSPDCLHIVLPQEKTSIE